MYASLTSSEKTILETLDSMGLTACKPKQIRQIAEDAGVERKVADRLLRHAGKVRYGVYNFQPMIASIRGETTETPATNVNMSVQSTVDQSSYVPEVDKHFVRWGNYKDIERVVKSQEFYPTFITGLSGNGKTMMVEQACAKLKREYIRVQITPETDEDDLIGGFRLLNGDTVFNKGPVVKAMEQGAVLLIDEIDRGSNKIMCLQGVLEGKPIMIKKTGEVIKPEKGFNVIATANTKGQGSEDGRFVAATIIDDAFLERFIITVEQTYPTLATERKIITKHMEKFDCVDSNFAEMIVNWADTIRKTFEDGGVDETISTRRLCHIVQTFSIFGDRRKSIELCVSRFDEDTKEAFIDLYEKVDASIAQCDTSIDEQQSMEDVLDAALGNDPFADSPDTRNGKPATTNPY